MTNEELIKAGYKQYPPSPIDNECVTDLFQKCVTDEYGKRYFINIKRWDFRKYGDQNGVNYESDMQLTHKNGNYVNIKGLSGWKLDELEKFFADIWNTGWFKYYEAFYGHEESEF